MEVIADYAPPYSLALIVGANKGTVPESIEGRVISATRDCIAVGCRAEHDGETRFLMGSKGSVDPGRNPDFSGLLETPDGVVMLHTIVGDLIAEMKTSDNPTPISIWVNDEREPDEVRIGVGL